MKHTDYTNIPLVGRYIYFKATPEQKRGLAGYLTPEKLYKIVTQEGYKDSLITIYCDNTSALVTLKQRVAYIYIAYRTGHIPIGCKWRLARPSTVFKAKRDSHVPGTREVQL